jgi:uncharacterized protein (DUF2267 family)
MSTDGIFMTKEKAKIYRYALKAINGDISTEDFAQKINKSLRQAIRIKQKIAKEDFLGLKHGNTGKVPVNKTPKTLEDELINLLRGKYHDFNQTHFIEKIYENEGIKIKKDVLARIAKENGLQKATYRRKNRVHKPRVRLPREGMLLQFDGSEHKWFLNIVTDLLLAIDDATGKIVEAEFFYGETSNNVMKVLKDIVQNNGIPDAFYFDQAGIYGKQDREWESQIARALDELDCELILASTPQAKGRVERVFRTLQDRLISELRLQKLECIKDANKYLKEVFIPKFNEQFSVIPADATLAYRENRYDLEMIFCKKESRKIGGGNTFGYKSYVWVVDEKFNYTNRKLNINTHLDGSITFDIMGRKVTAQKTNKDYRFVKRVA